MSFYDYLQQSDPDYLEGIAFDTWFSEIKSTSHSTLSTDLLSDQGEKGEFAEHNQDQQAGPLVQSQPPPRGSNLSSHYDTTNTDPAAIPKANDGFIFPAANSYSYGYPSYSDTSRATPPAPPHHAIPPPRKSASPQHDGRFDSSPADSTLSVRTGSSFSRLGSKCLHPCEIELV